MPLSVFKCFIMPKAVSSGDTNVLLILVKTNYLEINKKADYFPSIGIDHCGLFSAVVQLPTLEQGSILAAVWVHYSTATIIVSQDV